MNFFRDQVSNPKTNAQYNLAGRTHFVDDDTLRFHNSRVIRAQAVANGLLFAIVTSETDTDGKRGFQFSLFDLFGTVLARQSKDKLFASSNAAHQALIVELGRIDARAHTLEALAESQSAYIREMQTLRAQVEAK